MGRWVSQDGHEVEAVVLDSRSMLRVQRWYGDVRYLIAYCTSVQEVAKIVDLATLTEVDNFPAP
ncbi:transposase [Spongiactinospora rosea]|uniref:Transposase n=1 Tax=Spongiactinospora rosea TaxID=2248750 RepID=A0A366M627_9ACTN|nr:transposase [Spongiactinospora rosea]RBQ21635.1 transposase [Spongiactinospora rosea]